MSAFGYSGEGLFYQLSCTREVSVSGYTGEISDLNYTAEASELLVKGEMSDFRFSVHYCILESDGGGID